MSDLINLSICLSDIPKDRMQKSEKNGKVYTNISVARRREVDQYGKTHTVYMNQSKEERDARADKIYVGNGKEFIFNQTSSDNTTNSVSEDDLPF